MRKILLIVSLLLCCGIQVKYNYASEDAKIHCQDECPGDNCLCILGNDNTWYLSPEIGDEE